MDISSNKIVEFVDSDDNLALGAFLYQITAKDIAANASQWNADDLQGKIEMAANIIAGRTLGAQVFQGQPAFPANFQLGNAINKTSLLGAGLYLANEAGLIGGKWGSRGKKIMFGGAVGGVFDAPAYGGGTVPPTSHPRNGLQTARAAGWMG